MMKRWFAAYVALVLFAAGFSSTAFAQDGATVKVSITGLKGTEGVALITLYDSEANWLKVPKAVQVLRLKITGATMTVEFKGVKPGTYAVSVVHDANKNNELDMRWLPWPQPKEGTGSSKGAEVAKEEPGKQGPPKWSNAKFEVTDKDTSVSAAVKYFD